MEDCESFVLGVGNGEEIRERLAAVKNDGKIRGCGQIEIALEKVYLKILGRMFVVIVESGFSNGAEFALAYRGFEEGERRFTFEGDIVGSGGSGVSDVGVASGKEESLTESFRVGADVQDMRNSGLFRSKEYRV